MNSVGVRVAYFSLFSDSEAYVASSVILSEVFLSTSAPASPRGHLWPAERGSVALRRMGYQTQRRKLTTLSKLQLDLVLLIEDECSGVGLSSPAFEALELLGTALCQ